MPLRESSFLFICCQVGAEPALKAELGREHPEFRFAYSRPGFVTFKRQDGAPIAPDFELRSVFARAYGLSCGRTLAAAPDAAQPVRALLEELASAGGKPPRLHLWERDQHFPGDEPLGFVRDLWADEARAALGFGTAAGSDSRAALAASVAEDGDWVLDVIAVEPGEWWYGFHRQTPAHAPWPGGRPTVTLPAESPSRAYVKLEEAILWSKAPIKRDDFAVEIGSAPGGASYALLERGLTVVGIDPGQMHPTVASHPRFSQIQKPVAQVPREHLPESVQWLLLDMNVEPRISLFAVDRLAHRMSDTLLGMFLTVKLNQWRIAKEIPAMLEHVRVMGMVEARATQLASNRQEILIYGMTALGQRRLRRPLLRPGGR